MNKSHLLPLSFIFGLLFVFFKIYQHNKMIKLVYQQQRIEKSQKVLDKNKNKLLIQLHQIKNKKNIKQAAQSQLGMKDLQVSQMMSFAHTNTCR
jgi:hypothetical protein